MFVEQIICEMFNKSKWNLLKLPVAGERKSPRNVPLVNWDLLKTHIVGERKSPRNVPSVKKDLLETHIVGERKSPRNVPSVKRIYSNFPAAIKNHTVQTQHERTKA